MKRRRLTSSEIQKIKDLRSNGHSLPEIGKALSIPKTTVFRYVKDVKILPEFLTEWSIKRGGSRKRKLLKETKAFEEGKTLVGSLSVKEKLLFLSALYWAEGSKKDFGLSNTDPMLIKIFVTGLREVFGITDDQLRISIRLYEDLDKDKSLSFWSQIVNIPKEEFIGVNVLVGKKKGKLEHGMCRVRVLKGGDILKKVNGINKAVIEASVPIAQLDRASRS